MQAYSHNGDLVATHAMIQGNAWINEFGNVGQFALHPSGALYAVEPKGLELGAYDIGYGAGQRVEFGFGDGSDFIQTETTDGSALVIIDYPSKSGFAGPPTILPDGSVRIEYATVYRRTYDFWYGNQLWCHGTLTSMTISPSPMTTGPKKPRRSKRSAVYGALGRNPRQRRAARTAT